MKSIKWFYLALMGLVLFPLSTVCFSAPLKLVFTVSTRDSMVTARAIREILADPDIADRCRLEFYTDREIRSQQVTGEQINTADILLVDFMKREFDDFLTEVLENKKTDIYSLRCSYLARGLKKKGFVPDPRTEAYYQPSTVENLKNLVRMVLSHKGMKIAYEAPFVIPDAGFFHPASDTLFADFSGFLEWYKKTGKYKPDGFWVGIHTFRTSAIKENGKLEGHIITALEDAGINALPVFGKPPYHESLETCFLDQDGHSRVEAILGFSFRFLRGFPEKTRKILTRINAPVFIPLEAHGITIDQWERSDAGISTLRTAWQVCIPEFNGGIEPTMVGGKTRVSLKGMKDAVYDRVPMPDQIAFLIKRIQAWHRLKIRPNARKKIALLYWNHPPGKQNIGGSYMNCFRSIATIIAELKKQGYTVDAENLTEEAVKERILLGARNVGSWAPGELERLVAAQGVVKVPVSEYKEWFAALPGDFKARVISQWGEPEHADIMIKDGDIIIPQVCLGNLILMPQPSRGFGEDAEKLYHDPKIYPHHQYIAFYLWLKKKFQADAIISLGKHGTHEWLPGKQIGLSMTDPPDILIQDIPNIYPYIVDNIGEGIQAKRRGRGVIIDHLIPPLKKGGVYMEYRKLTASIDAYHNALKLDQTLAREKFSSAADLIRKLGIHKDLGYDAVTPGIIAEVEHYILELQESLIPYGHHTFGVSPKGESLGALTDAICEASPEIPTEEMRSRLEACGKSELSALVTALNGGYLPPGEGNDPVRNPDAVPTGRNFYGFNIDKVPSREAWTMGRKLSREMIDTYRKKHGAYPEKLGLILWSTELQRNEGATVAAVLHLLGIMPVWDQKDQVVDIVPIPGTVLKRPRIDVLIQSSGLFRDSYAKVIKLMDRAVRMAASLKDVENFILVHNQKIEADLLEKGVLS